MAYCFQCPFHLMLIIFNMKSSSLSHFVCFQKQRESGWYRRQPRVLHQRRYIAYTHTHTRQTLFRTSSVMPEEDGSPRCHWGRSVSNNAAVLMITARISLHLLCEAQDFSPSDSLGHEDLPLNLAFDIWSSWGLRGRVPELDHDKDPNRHTHYITDPKVCPQDLHLKKLLNASDSCLYCRWWQGSHGSWKSLVQTGKVRECMRHAIEYHGILSFSV